MKCQDLYIIGFIKKQKFFFENVIAAIFCGILSLNSFLFFFPF